MEQHLLNNQFCLKAGLVIILFELIKCLPAITNRTAEAAMHTTTTGYVVLGCASLFRLLGAKLFSDRSLQLILSNIEHRVQ